MNSDKKTRHFILLVGTGIVIIILILLFSFMLLFGSSDTSTDVIYTDFPDSPAIQNPTNKSSDPVSSSTTEVARLSDGGTDYESKMEQQRQMSDWRDEVVYVSGTGSTGGGGVTDQSPITDNQATYQSNIDQLNSAAEYLRNYTPPLPDNWPFSSDITPESIAAMDREEYAKLFFPSKLETIGLRDCGNITVDLTEADSRNFQSSIDNNDAVICMGNMVANGCGTSKLKVSVDVTPWYLYVAKRDDGSCGVGYSYDNKILLLCRLDEFMNLYSGTTKSTSEWLLYYNTDPGAAFGTIVASDPVGFNGTETVLKLDCKNYEL